MGKRFFSTIVKPGTECKVELPPCSAIEMQHCALAEGGAVKERCTLECDLATHSFVLCSLPPGGPMQARLGTVVTNDPSVGAWLFLKAKGPRAFHVIGRLAVDDDQEGGAARLKTRKRRAAATDEEDYGRSRIDASVVGRYSCGDSAVASSTSGFAVGDGWATAADVRPTLSRQQQKADAGKAAEAIDKAIRFGARSAKGSGLSAKGPNGVPLAEVARSKASVAGGGGSSRQGKAAEDDAESDSNEDGMIEVLLPEGDDSLGGYSLSDAESEDFVQWMHMRTTKQQPSKPAQQPKPKGKLVVSGTGNGAPREAGKGGKRARASPEAAVSKKPRR